MFFICISLLDRYNMKTCIDSRLWLVGEGVMLIDGFRNVVQAMCKLSKF